MGGPLTEKQEKLLALFKVAIESERKAQELYRKTLLLSEEPSLRVIIESFIRAEKEHEEILIGKYTELRKTDEFKDVTS